MLILLYVVSKNMFEPKEYEKNIKTDNYEYNIKNIKTGNKLVDQKINKYIDNKISFVKKKTKYKMQIDYKISEYKNIKTFDFKEVEYSDSKKIAEEHKIYNIKDGQAIKLTDVFDKKTDYKNFLQDRLYYFSLMFMNENSIKVNEDKLKKLVSIDTCNDFYINEDGINFVISLSNISDYSEIITKTFTYSQLSEYLKENFKIYINESFEKTRVTRNIDYFKDKKIVAITFDDGPSNLTTNRLLDELDKRGVKVTFFVVGTNAEKNPDIIKRMYLEGHDIGIHTYSHSNLLKLSDEEIYSQKSSVVDIVKSATGFEPTLLRPPYGNIDDRVKSIYPMKNILWNVDSEDWKSRNADIILEQIMSTTDDGDIVLFHDIYDTSVDGALKSIDELSRQGYSFVTINELLQIKGDTKDTYYGF